MGQRVAGRKGCQCHGCSDGLVELSRIAESANQPVMRLDMGWVYGNGRAERLRRFRRQSGGEQVESVLGKRVGSMRIGHGWL